MDKESTSSPPLVATKDNDQLTSILFIIDRVIGIFLIIIGLILTLCTLASFARYTFLQKKRYILLGNLTIMSMACCVKELVQYLILDLPKCSALNETFVVMLILHSLLYDSMTWTILLMAMDKFIALVWPLRYSTWVTKARIIVLLVAFLLLSICAAAVDGYVFIRQGFGGYVCTGFRKFSGERFAIGFTAYLASALLLGALYGKILHIAKTQQKVIAGQLVEVNMGSLPSAARTERNTTVRVKQTRGAKVIIAVLTSYVLLWMPNYLTPIMNRHGNASPTFTGVWYTVAHILVIANLSVAIVLYVWLNQDFREAYRKLASRRRRSRVQPWSTMAEGQTEGHERALHTPSTCFTLQDM